MKTLELPGQRLKTLMKMLVRRVLMTLNVRPEPRLIWMALGDREGRVRRGLGEAGPA